MSFTMQEQVNPIEQSKDQIDSEIILELEPSKDRTKEEALADKISRIHQDLSNVIQAMKKNKSIFSIMADFWGSKPWWLKTIIASVIILPIVITAIVFQLYMLLAAGIVLALVYTGFSLLLDDHKIKDQEALEELEAGVFALADLLVNLISDLDNIRANLAKEVEHFTKENGQLTQSVQDLEQKNKHIQEQMKSLTSLNESLKNTNQLIKNSEQDLAELLTKEKELSLKNQELRQEEQREYQTRMKQLEETIAQLQNMNSALEAKIEDLHNNCEILLDTNKKLTELNEQEEVNRINYYQQVSEDWDEKDKKKHQAVDTFGQAALTMQGASNRFKDTLEESSLLLSQGLFKNRSERFNKQNSDTEVLENLENACSGR